MMKSQYKVIAKPLLSPQSLISLVVCLVALSFYIKGEHLGYKTPSEVKLNEAEPSPLESRQIELVMFDENQLERPVFKTVSIAKDLTSLVKALVEELKTELPIWPKGLQLATVFSLDDGSIILDFSLEPDMPYQGINDEWRLLRSLKASLKRNGFENTRILIDHEESRYFLKYIRLDADY